MTLQWIIIVLLSFKLHNIHASDDSVPPQSLITELPVDSSDAPPNAAPQYTDQQYTAKLFANEEELKEQHSDAQYLVNLEDPKCQRRFHLFGNLQQLINHHIRKYVHHNDICPHLNLMLKDFQANINLVGDINGHKWSSKQKAKGTIIYVTNAQGSAAEINAENILNTFLLKHVRDSYYNIDPQTSKKILEYSDQPDIPQIFCLWQADGESSYIKSIWTMKTVTWTWRTTTELQAAIITCVEGPMDSTGGREIDADTKQQILSDGLLKEAQQPPIG